VHGEALHLAEHAALARSLRVATLTCRNGDLIRLAPGAPEIVDEVPSGRLYKDGRLLIDAAARTIADRKRLSYNGIVVVAMVLNDKGVLLANPEVELIGIPEVSADNEPMAEIAYGAA